MPCLPRLLPPSVAMPALEAEVAWAIGGVTTTMAVVLSLRLMGSHLQHYVKPKQQRLILNILGMVRHAALG